MLRLLLIITPIRHGAITDTRYTLALLLPMERRHFTLCRAASHTDLPRHFTAMPYLRATR